MLITTLTPNSLPSATILPSRLDLTSVVISTPLCYPSEFKQITCLGYVENQSTSSIGDVTLEATFWDTSDMMQGQTEFTLEQRIVNPDHVAPYRIQIPEAQLETNYLQIRLISAYISSEIPLQLRLLNMQGTYNLDDNLYIFSAELENPTAFDASQTRLIIT